MALSRDKAIVAGVVVLGGLSALLYRQVKHDQQLGTESVASVPDVKGTDDLDKLEITNGSKPTVTLVKEGDNWMLQSPHVAANGANVKLLLDNLKELKGKEVISSTADDALKTSYELDAAHALHFVGSKAGAVKVDDLFGKAGGRGQMMMITGQPQIIAISGYSSYLYGREPKDWREKEIFKFDDTNASSFAITDKAGYFSCAKGDKWSCTFNGQPIPNFDDSKPGDILRTFKALSADDFAAEGKTTADCGLDKPEGNVTIALKDGAGKYVLNVGAVSTGTSRFAVKDGEPTIYVINANASGWATATLDKFQKSPDAGAPAGGKTASAMPPHPMPPMPKPH